MNNKQINGFKNNSVSLREGINLYLQKKNSVEFCDLYSLAPQQIDLFFHQAIADAVTINIDELKKHLLITDYNIKTSYDDFSVRIYSPMKANNLPILVYYHGGGWVAGSIESHNTICCMIAYKSNCIIVSVDYKLAPKVKFYTILLQCYTALQWVNKNAHCFGANKNRIAVGGDSAGANIAITMTLMAKDIKQNWNIKNQILICPITNLSELNTESYKQNGDYGLNRNEMCFFRDLYLNNDDDCFHPYASPLLARDFYNLPPALVLVGEYDVLRDDGKQYVEKLKTYNVKTEYYFIEKMIHSSIFWPSGSNIIKSEIDFVCSYIRDNF